MVSPNYAQKLGHCYQKILSGFSYDFVCKLLYELPGELGLKQVFPMLHQSSEGRMALPCYSVTKIILLHMIHSRANIVLLVNIGLGSYANKIAYYLKRSQNKHGFTRQRVCEKKGVEPGIILHGDCSTNAPFFERKFDALGLQQIILANSAAHSQYSGANLKELRDNPFQVIMDNKSNDQLSQDDTNALFHLSAELVRMKQLAENIGCTVRNHKLFLLKHIFCDTVSAHFDPEVWPRHHQLILKR